MFVRTDALSSGKQHGDVIQKSCLGAGLDLTGTHAVVGDSIFLTTTKSKRTKSIVVALGVVALSVFAGAIFLNRLQAPGKGELVETLARDGYGKQLEEPSPGLLGHMVDKTIKEQVPSLDYQPRYYKLND